MKSWKCPHCRSIKSPDYILSQERIAQTKIEEGYVVVDEEDLTYSPITEVGRLRCTVCSKVSPIGDFAVERQKELFYLERKETL